jgi:dipeptidyl aminopeptidase/acylaminoacyl peptidase
MAVAEQPPVVVMVVVGRLSSGLLWGSGMGVYPASGCCLASVAAFGLLAVVVGIVVVPPVHADHRATLAGEVAYTRVAGDQQLGDARSWIAVADLAGTRSHEVTRRPGKDASRLDHSPVWSPDGSRLAFVRDSRNGSGSGLYVANHDGTRVRRVLRLEHKPYPWYGYDADDFSWSPDGRQLAFADGPLYVLNRDGTNRRLLVASSACSPTWSPDGRKLIYLVDTLPCNTERGGNAGAPGYRGLYRIDADGSHRRLLAHGSLGDAAWSPDGHQLAVTTACDVHHGGDWFCSVFLMKPDGSRKRRLVKSSYGGWVEWIAGGKDVVWPDFPVFYAADVASGRTQRILPPSYKTAILVGISTNGRRLAVAVIGWRHHAWVPQSPRVISISGQLLKRITVPSDWRYEEISVHLP